ncbi:ATP-binding protein [Jannaschia ovalis]|uniref:ATP-binding protein n=1 Tax=Jannaschia ovalis TaxID=3038773 RepID=UPI003266C293
MALANPAARDVLGAWIVGQPHMAVLRQPALVSPVEDALAGGIEGRARITHSSGAVEAAYEVRITPLDGTVLLVFRDLTEAQAGASQRRDFVANVSHELKTPLTAIAGFIETLQGPARDDPAARGRFLAMMAQEVARMDRLVSDLLSLSRLEGQARRRPTDRLDLAALASEAAGLLRPGAEAEGVRIALDLPEAAPVQGDRDQLMQVLSNLIENAVKYGARPGRVTLTLQPVAREPVLRARAWRLEVADDGPGIAPEHVPRLTERFYRVDTGRSRAQGGTGLGLSIVKHIVNRHRGRLRIESAPGEGTRVSVILPAA